MPTTFARYPSLRGRTVVITGGATGIGAAMVRYFARQHARVALLDILPGQANALIRRLAPVCSAPLSFYNCDLRDIPALQSTVAAIRDRFTTIDVLINNAASDTRHSLEAVTPEAWDQSIAVNLRHQFFMAQAVLPAMQAARRGSIINLSSIAFKIPSPDIPLYNTAKSAILGLTRSLAHHAGTHNIRVNCILPGAIVTHRQRREVFTPQYEAEILAAQALKHLIRPAEVARLALFLAADDSASITSQALTIDAGWT